MDNSNRVYSSREFDVPEFMDESRINSGVEDPNYQGRMTRLSHKAKLKIVNENEEAFEKNKENNIKPSKKSKKKKEYDPNDRLAKIRKIVKFLLIHVGIFLLVITYAVAGAFLFQLLEQHQEIQNCQMGQGKTQESVKDYRSKFVNYILFNITTNEYLDNSTNKDPSKVYNPKITGLLKDLRDEILSYYSKYKYSGQDCEKQSLWVFSSAFLFAMTVITTIGYGHVSPTTWEGQIVCICYATVGIPLFLMGVANISSILSDMSRFIYKSLSAFIKSFFSKNENEKDEIQSEKENDEENNDRKIEGIINKSGSKRDLNDDNNPTIEAVEDEDEEEEQDENTAVPLFLIFIIFSSYLYIGSVIFSNIEDWINTQSAYFSFVSLSTMGFGDLVPGISAITSGDSSKGSRNLIIATFYIIIGMSLLAMCFELIQDQIVNKVKHLSQLLGIHTEEEKKDDESEIEVVDEKAEKEENINNDAFSHKVPQSAVTLNDGKLEIQDIQNNQTDYEEYNEPVEMENKTYNSSILLVRSASTKRERSRERSNFESKC